MKASLNTQTKQFNIIINTPTRDNIYIKRLATFLDNEIKNRCSGMVYTYIEHDNDYLGDKLKTYHIHLLIWNYGKTRLLTLLNRIADALQIDNTIIQIDIMRDIVGSVQYLVHKNDCDKYQYEVSNIKTNLTSNELETYINSANEYLTADRLINLCDEIPNRILLLKAIGLKDFKLYFHIIKMIYDFKNGITNY